MLFLPLMKNLLAEYILLNRSGKSPKNLRLSGLAGTFT